MSSTLSAGLGRFSQASQVWNAAVEMLTAILENVRVDDDTHNYGLFVPHSHDAADSIDDAMEASTEGVRALKISLFVLLATTLLQAVIVAFSGSVALLADTVHNFSDALTAVPLWVAFVLGRRVATRRYTYGYGRAEDLAGLFIIAVVALSAVVAAWQSIDRLFHPHPLENLGWVIVAGLLGFARNGAVAIYRIRVGRRIGLFAPVRLPPLAFLGKEGERGGQMRRDHDQRLLVAVAEGKALDRFRKQHTDEPSPRDKRQRDLTERLVKRRKRDRRLILDACHGPHRLDIALAAAEIGDPHITPPLGRNPDNAAPGRNLGAKAELVVAAAGDRRQPAAFAVRHQHHGMVVAEELAETLKRHVEQRFRIAAL